MLSSFKDLSKEEQYKIINEYIQKIEEECIELRETINQNSTLENKGYKKSIITKLNKFPMSVNIAIDLISNSKLSNEFKKILIQEINLKLAIIKNNKTR